jgi:hypothetical protein
MDVDVPTRTSFMIGWLALLAISAALFLLVAAVAWWQHRRRVPGKARQRRERAEWARHATAVTERAGQAATRAVAVRARVEPAEQARAAAWRELEEVETAYDEAAGKYREVLRRDAEHPPDRAGQRLVASAALAAYRRGDLTQEQLWRVWRWGSGWDPERDQRERELSQLRAARRDAHLRYRAAASGERAVLAAADVAEVEARALAEEVATAATEAGWDDGHRDDQPREESRAEPE